VLLLCHNYASFLVYILSFNVGALFHVKTNPYHTQTTGSSAGKAMQSPAIQSPYVQQAVHTNHSPLTSNRVDFSTSSPSRYEVEGGSFLDMSQKSPDIISQAASRKQKHQYPPHKPELQHQYHRQPQQMYHQQQHSFSGGYSPAVRYGGGSGDDGGGSSGVVEKKLSTTGAASYTHHSRPPAGASATSNISSSIPLLQQEDQSKIMRGSHHQSHHFGGGMVASSSSSGSAAPPTTTQSLNPSSIYGSRKWP
jgi:hypothetical protein